MNNADLIAVATISTPCLGALVWLVRLEGRINAHDLAFQRLRDDVSYIRDRIDRAIERGNE